MAIYRKVKRKSGSAIPNYSRDGWMIPTQYVPPEVMKELEDKEEYEDTAKRCVVCLGRATHTRFADMQVVDLCEQDYYNKRMGEVVQALRQVKEYERVRKEKRQKRGQEVKEDGLLDAGQEVATANTPEAQVSTL